MIQLYGGNNRNGQPIWIDTLWKTVKQAKSKFPKNTYRKVKIASYVPRSKQNFYAEEQTCLLLSKQELREKGVDSWK